MVSPRIAWGLVKGTLLLMVECADCKLVSLGFNSLNVLFDLEFIFLSWILFKIYAALAVSPRNAWGFLILIFLYLGLLQIVA